MTKQLNELRPAFLWAYPSTLEKLLELDDKLYGDSKGDDFLSAVCRTSDEDISYMLKDGDDDDPEEMSE